MVTVASVEAAAATATAESEEVPPPRLGGLAGHWKVLDDNDGVADEAVVDVDEVFDTVVMTLEVGDSDDDDDNEVDDDGDVIGGDRQLLASLLGVASIKSSGLFASWSLLCWPRPPLTLEVVTSLKPLLDEESGGPVRLLPPPVPFSKMLASH